MTQEELITYGVKRVIEELQKIEGHLAKIEQNTFTASGEAIETKDLAAKINNSGFITMMEAIRIRKHLEGTDKKDGGLEEPGL